MAILRMRDAMFHASGAPVGPLTFDVRLGERTGSVFVTPREASIVALMAAGIVKAGSGNVFIEEYDPRVQAARAKRLVGFVAHAALTIEEADFERYVVYRGALCGVDPLRAIAHAKLLRDRLQGIHEAFAFPVIGALVTSPKLLVLDRPQAAYASRILAVAGPCAVFSTHADEAAARAFSQPLAELVAGAR